MNKIELYKMGRGFVPASDEAIGVHKRMSQGEIGWFKPIRVRDIVAHRRYWKLLTMCAENCERLELPYGGFMEVHSKDDIHTAIKLWAGHVTTIFDANGKPAFQIPKSTDFESMTSDEWAEYWPRVLDIVQEHILPGIQIPEVEYELQRCMGWAR